MDDEQPLEELRARERATPNGERQPNADERERLNYREHHPQARTRQQVVRQGVARETLEHGQEQQRHADDPVDLTRTAEGPGEENAAHVERN